MEPTNGGTCSVIYANEDVFPNLADRTALSSLKGLDRARQLSGFYVVPEELID